MPICMTCKDEVDKVYKTRRCPPCNSAATKKWRQKNKEAVNENQRAYKKANRAIYTAAQGRRRAQALQATPLWANDSEIKKHYDFAARFKESFGLDLHVDHIVPLKGEKVCGLHVENNLQVTLAHANLAKNNQFEVA